jgi:predicted nucleic acid-binding protein
VRLVIADTSPINYLILIGHIEVLHSLFQSVILPNVVRRVGRCAPFGSELDCQSPTLGRSARARKWPPGCSLRNLDAGEEDAIALAVELQADLLLMDDREGVLAARRKGFTVTGTLGVLALAAQHGLLNLAEAFDRMKRTNFRYRQDTMDALLAEASGPRPPS